ncbi:hypothetical protein REPUB_Repub02eG0255600 [Reevesia pubescens]
MTFFFETTDPITAGVDEEHNLVDEPMHEVCMEGEFCVNLNMDEKIRIRQRWEHSLIVKVHGKTIGHRFQVHKLDQLWSSISKPSIVELGHDFFLLKFQYAEYFIFVIKRGPWFINGHFLTFRKWEPNFRASEASFSLVAV